MTADVIPFPNRGGRPSNASLAALRERIDDLEDELRAVADERALTAETSLVLLSNARRELRSGRAPFAELSELTYLARREHARAAAMNAPEEVAA